MGYRYLRYIVFAVLAFGAALQHSYAQQTPASEADLKKQATKLFEEEEFGAAMPMYSQLVSNYPKETAYNYRFGVCLLFASDNKEEPIKYLEFASQKPDAEKEVFFYLGKAYHLNYRFDDAIKAYNQYKAVASSKQQKKMEIDREIEACNNGKKLLRYITDITVLEKKELSKENFFYSYDLKGMNGKLVVKPAELITSLDKKKKDKSVVFSNIGSGVMYFSSYGDKGEAGRDIYVSKRLPNGELGKPQLVPGPVNTPYDEDYPYLHPDGKVLYFCSKGHNSMGGYDLFKSVFDETTNTWGKPVNLDFPINTPDDDILYVTDGDEENAYFSSARGSIDGKIAVYKVRVERRPIDVSMIKGEVKPSRSDQKLNSKITVKDLSDGQIVGVYYGNEKNGNYLLYLPNGGKFLFTVETEGFKPQSEVVQLPVQYELKMMKQAISYDMNEKLVITNMFDGQEDDGTYELAMDVIKDKAKLDVNKDEPVPNTVDPLAVNDGNNSEEPKNGQDNQTEPTPVAENLNNDELVQIAYEDAKEATEEAKELKSEAELANSIATEKNELALAKAKEAQTILANANSITNPVKKQAEIDKANNLNKEADRLTKETVAAMNLANTLSADAKTKDEEAKLSQQYAQQLERAAQSNSPDDLEKVQQMQAKLDELNKRGKSSNTVYSSMKSEADNKQRELVKAKEKSESLQQDIDDLDKQVQSYRSEANSTKNEDLKNSIIAQAQELEEEKKGIQKELDANNEKVAHLQDEADRLKNDLELVSSLITKIKGSEPPGNNVNDGGANETGSDNIVATTRKNNNTSGNDQGAGNSGADETGINEGNSGSTANISPENGNSSTKAGNETVNDENASSGASTSNSEPVDYAMEFESSLGEVEKLEDESEKESAKAKIYSDWVEDINKDIEETKLAQKNAKSKDEKKLYKMKLEDLQKQKKEKEQLVKEAQANAEKAKQNEALATNSNGAGNAPDPGNGNSATASDPVNAAGNNTAPPLAYSQDFDKKLEALEKEEGTPYQKEKDRENTYREWVKAINNDIAIKQEEANATADPEMKALLEAKINDLKELAREKEDLANESARKIESLKGQENVLVNNDNGSSNSDPSGTSNAGNGSGNSSTENIGDYSAQRQKELDSANQLTSEYEKESAKAKIYENWTNDIKTEIVSLQEELKNTKDEARKKELSAKIGEKEAEVKEKEKIAQGSAQNAEKLKDQENVLVNNDNGSSNSDPSGTSNAGNGSGNSSTENIDDYSAQRQKELDSADQLPSEYEKESAKAKIYENWTNDIKAEIVSLQEELKNTKDRGRKKELSAKIKEKEAEVKEKEKIAQESAQNAEKLKGQEDVLANNDTGSNNNDPSGVNYAGNNSAGNEGSDTGSNSPNNNSSLRYTAPDVIVAEQKANSLINEAEKLEEQSEALRSDGSYEEAEQLSKQAETKKIEAATLIGEANKEQFTLNNDQLEQLAKASAKRTEEDLALAELLKDEAKTYFEKAQQSRKLADEATETYAKQNAMEKAYADEIKALTNQEKARTIYLKYNPDFIASNNGTNGSTNDPAGENGLATNNDPSGNNGSRTNEGSASNNGTNGSANDPAGENGLATNNDPSGNNGSRANEGAASNNGTNGSANDPAGENGLATNNDPSGNNGSRTNEGSANNNGTNGSANDPSSENGLAGNNDPSGNNGSRTNEGAASNNGTNGSANDPAGENDLATNNDPSGNNGSRTNEGAANNNGTNGSTNDPAGENGLAGNNNSPANNGNNDPSEAGTLTPEDIARVKSTTEYKSYISLKEEANATSQEAKREKQVAEQFNTQAQKLEDQATQKQTEAAASTDEGQRQDALRKADEYSRLARINRSKADSVQELAENTQASANAKRMEADLFLQSLDQATYENISAVTGDKRPDATVAANNGNSNRVNEPGNTNDEGTNNGNSNGGTGSGDPGSGSPNSTGAINAGNPGTIPVTYISANDKFERTTGSAYSPSAPIPIDEKLPEGLVFKVQIGAFRNAIPQDLFSGMKPITGETTPQGVIRYTAGLFKNPSTAERAKEDIRSLGYKDAFVVSFYNGKRISMGEAMKLLGEDPLAVSASNSSNPGGNDAGSNNNVNDRMPVINDPGSAPSENINVVKGLLYTVQVGVYARPVSSVQLYNIQPLYNEIAPNGYIRYTSGIYNNIDKAIEARKIILNIGISDAFVTAYYNGKRISVAEAKQLEATNGNGVFASTNNMNVLPSRGQGGNITQLGSNIQGNPVVEPVVSNGDSNAAGNDNGNNGQSSGSSNTAVSPRNNGSAQSFGGSIADKVAASVEDEGVVYKVQIGAFREEVPIEIANKFLRIASGGGIHTYKDGSGLTIYSLGVYKSYDQANALKADLVKEGLTDAFVVAFENGTRISVDRARDLLGK